MLNVRLFCVIQCESDIVLTKFPNQKSRHCIEPQRFTRCPSCKRVCLVESAHRRSCPSIHFRSETVNPLQEVSRSKPMVELGSLHVKEINIKTTFTFDKLNQHELLSFVKKNIVIHHWNNKLKFHSFPVTGGAGDPLMYNGGMHILIYDQKDIQRFHIYATEENVLINGELQLSKRHGLSKGTFHQPPRHIPIKIVVNVITPNVRKFGVKVDAFGLPFAIFSYTDKPSLIIGQGWWSYMLSYFPIEKCINLSQQNIIWLTNGNNKN